MLKQLTFKTFFIMAISFGLIPRVSAEIYRTMDASGHVSYSDQEANFSTSIKQRIRVVNKAEVSEANLRVLDDSQVLADPRVILYATPDCEPCNQARRYFKKHRIAYTEYDPINSVKGFHDFQSLGRFEVPLIIFGDKQMLGWDSMQFDIKGVLIQ